MREGEVHCANKRIPVTTKETGSFWGKLSNSEGNICLLSYKQKPKTSLCICTQYRRKPTVHKQELCWGMMRITIWQTIKEVGNRPGLGRGEPMPTETKHGRQHVQKNQTYSTHDVRHLTSTTHFYVHIHWQRKGSPAACPTTKSMQLPPHSYISPLSPLALLHNTR